MTDKKINLQDFCDMDKLYSILDNWSKSTGASAVVVDMEGNRTSESFGMTKMCQMIHDTKKGYELCSGTWMEDKKGVYICPMGFSACFTGRYKDWPGYGRSDFANRAG